MKIYPVVCQGLEIFRIYVIFLKKSEMMGSHQRIFLSDMIDDQMPGAYSSFFSNEKDLEFDT
jgi:hypothetical protein